ncbi:NADH-quinone oxidoreductase subunit NuoK [Kyrpidia tusciae]|uniref:NADH-quinone oxidoreductase subunit K n=1 Tax=Kyrpidia tusciae (strain DSM 2912 / NBRC 15312 / T2) TaxID=562970 RepID=D5WV50_KYRT2|nr:NADH-quinone oxidoreductase subunit NuoK [Kyrpidia tusciae]ADG07522.1 NADH-ubiquinone oxidoreductase chain 4L [Kyrpidia tusciae DSM 2912]
MIGLQHYLLLAALLFALGLYGALTRRNTVIVLLSIELMLGAANLNLAALGSFLHGGGSPAAGALSGNAASQLFVLFNIAIAAAEVAVGVAILIALYRLRESVEVDTFDSLKDGP